MPKLILKKSLGQHFLTNETICKQIVALNDTSITHQLLEIGPGGGAITKYFIQQKELDFKAIEVDEEKANYLIRVYPQLKDKIILTDFLKANPPFEGAFNIAGNFPYNISTQILFKILDWKDQVLQVTGMFQKEVALRVAAKEGNKDYGVITILIQLFYNVNYQFDVQQSDFSPPPKVMSGVITLVRNDNPHDIKNYKKFSSFVKQAFSQRRKTLRNALKGFVEPDILKEEIWSKRAEQLSVSQFVAEYKRIFKDE